MKFTETFTKAFYSTKLNLKKHSPEMLIIAGAVGVVSATVMACKATLRLTDTLDDAKCDLEDLKIEYATGEITEHDYKQQLTKTYISTGKELAKMYAPAVVVGTAGLATMFASNNILKQKNAALGAAYAAVDGAFKRYRKNVVDALGKEQDYKFRHDIRTEEITETIVDEKGKEKTTKRQVDICHDNPVENSDYSRFFDEGSCEFNEHFPDLNLAFLNTQQRYANELLRTRGHLFLNEVYDMLDIPRSRAGQSVGWVYDEENPIGDNYVDFGIWDVGNERKRAFVNGHEKAILLDFNVDGPILDLLR